MDLKQNKKYKLKANEIKKLLIIYLFQFKILILIYKKKYKYFIIFL